MHGFFDFQLETCWSRVEDFEDFCLIKTWTSKTSFGSLRPYLTSCCYEALVLLLLLLLFSFNIFKFSTFIFFFDSYYLIINLIFFPLKHFFLWSGPWSGPGFFNATLSPYYVCLDLDLPNFQASFLFRHLTQWGCMWGLRVIPIT